MGAVRKSAASSSPLRTRRRRSAQLNRRPGQHYSLSPVTERRLQTLSLPFDVVAPETTAHVAAHDTGHVVTQDTLSHPPLAGAKNSTTQTGSLSYDAKSALVAQLSREVKRIEVAGRVQPDQLGRRNAVFSTGCSTIDGCLPCGGYESGTIIEYLQNAAGSGATTLALCAAREALTATDRFCVVVDWRQQFYPPAAAALGLDLKRIVIVRPTTLADRLWAIDQALRSPSIVAVIAEVEQLDDHAARRLQLAAESGGGLGLLVRHVHQRHQPSWAEVQWLVRPMLRASNPNSPSSVAAIATPAHRPLQLELLRVRGGQSGTSVQVQVNAMNGRVEPSTAAAAALARTLARTSQTPLRSKALPA